MIFYRRFFHCVFLLLLIGLCYSNTLENEWHFDDRHNIVENRNLHPGHFDSKELVRSFYSSTGEGPLYRPVANFTFALNYLYSGLDTTSYHVVNIAIHVLCAVFAYLVFVRTLALMGVEENESGGIGSSDIALLGAVLWALHPIQTQAVTYIVQRMASLACLFYMAAMYCYLRFRAAGTFPRKTFFLFLVFVLWGAGLGSKENAILLPLSLLVFEAVFYPAALRRHKRMIMACLACIVVLGSFFVLSHQETFSYYILEPYEKRPFTMYERLLTEPLILTRYLFLLCVPLADFLTLESDIFASTGLFSPPSTFFALVFILALLGVAIFSLKKHPLLRFAILFFFINHLVESSFIGLELYFEHRNYLPSIFLYLAAAYYFCRLLAWYLARRRQVMVGLFTVFMTLILVSEGNAAFLRNEAWKTDVSLYEDAVRKAPRNLRAHGLLGLAYMSTGDFKKAREFFLAAEQLYRENPHRYMGEWVAYLYFNLALLAVREEPQSPVARSIAINYLRKSLEIGPVLDLWQTYLFLGRLFLWNGDVERAETALRRAVALSGTSLDWRVFNLLGRVLYNKGKYDEAVGMFTRALDGGAGMETRLNLVASLLHRGEIELARREFNTIEYNDRSKLYLLYRALLDGRARKSACDRLAERLLDEGGDPCEFFAKVRKNMSPEVIFPDISLLKEDLLDSLEKILVQRELVLLRKMEAAKKCYTGQKPEVTSRDRLIQDS